MQQLLDFAPPAIDPIGTILYLFVVGEALDCVLFDGFLDIDRIARLFLAETFLAAVRTYVDHAESGRMSILGMHPTPAANFVKCCNGFIAPALEWNTDYHDQPNYTPGWGSLRLEVRYSCHRSKTDSFGLVEMAAKHMSDLAVATAIAKGIVAAPSSAKGYTSHESRVMQPNAYKSTPRPVLQTVMLSADRVCGLLLKEQLDIDPSGEKLVATSYAHCSVPLTPMTSDDTVGALLEEAEEDLGVVGEDHANEDLEAGMEQLHRALEGPTKVAEGVEQEQRLQAQVNVVAAVSTSARSQEMEQEAEEALSDVVGSAPMLDGSPTQPKRGATTPCSTQRDQMSSSWLVEFEAAVKMSDGRKFCEELIAIRKKTAAIAKTKAGQRVRSLEEQQAAFEAQVVNKNRTFLEHEGVSIDPASLMRLHRQKSLNSLRAFCKKGRLARWMAGSSALTGAEVAGDEATIQAGEVWSVLFGEKEVTPCIVYGAFHPYKGKLCPETDPNKPLMLKDITSIQLEVYGTRTTETTFAFSGRDHIREPRRMLSRLATSPCDPSRVDVSGCRNSTKVLVLLPQVLQEVLVLEGDPRISSLWRQLCPNSSTSNDDSLVQQAAQAVAAAAATAAGRTAQSRGARASGPTARTADGSTAAAAAAPAVPQPRHDPSDLVGKKVKKHFPGDGWFTGEIVAFEKPYYKITYDDGDGEEVCALTSR